MCYSICYFLVLLTLVLSSCTHTSKQTNAKVSKKGNSLYYFLVARFEEKKGEDKSSFFYLDQSIKKNPDSSYLLTKKAYQYAQENKLNKAYKLATQAYQKDKNNVDLLLLLGKIHTAQSQSQQAFPYYQKILTIDLEHEEAYLLLSQEYVALGRVGLAISTLKKLLEAKPSSYVGHLYLANIYTTHEKNYSKALHLYENLLEQSPDDPQILRLIAEVYLAQKNHRKALDVFLKLAQLSSGDMMTEIRIGLLYYELGQMDESIGIFQKILETHPESDRIHFYLGLLLKEKKNFSESLQHFGLVPSDSEFFEEAILQGVVILTNLQENVKALNLVENAIRKKPRVASFYDLLASLYIQTQDYEASLAILKKGVEFLPDNEQIYFALAIVYEKLGEWEKSIESMKTVLEINPQNALAINFIGYSYAERGSNLDEAKDLVERALKLKPDDGYIMDSLGWIYYQKGDFTQALNFLEKANRLSPNEPAILEHLGDIHLKKQNKKKAREFYEKGLFQLRQKENVNQKEKEQLERLSNKIGNL